jgi:hypothetical protein
MPDTKKPVTSSEADQAINLIVDHTLPWCRARLLHALAGAEEQGILREVLEEVTYGDDTENTIKNVQGYLRENGWLKK